MFTKIALAFAIVLGAASATYAAPRQVNHSPSQVTQPLYFKLATGAEYDGLRAASER